MSYENRKKRYEMYKGTPKLSDALRREFEGDERTEEQAEAEAKKSIKQKLAEEDRIHHHHH